MSETRTLTPEIMAAACNVLVPWIASLTFGRADLQTYYMDSPRGATLPNFRSPVVSLAPTHWNETIAS